MDAEEACTGITAQPLWFGDQSTPIFGWFDAPSAPGRDLAVVICPPFGYEAICTHRALRDLGRLLAAAGFPVLRFDYHGTGDSSGSDRQPDRVPAWLASITAAIDEVKALSRRKAVALIGMRLGAVLAATAAAGRNDVPALLLWAPILSGKAFLREMQMLHVSGQRLPVSGKRADLPGPAPGDAEAAGFVLSASTMAALRELDLLKLNRPPAPSAFIVDRDDLPEDNRLGQKLELLGVKLRRERIQGYSAMMQDPHRALSPRPVFEAMAGWLAHESQLLGDHESDLPGPLRADRSIPLETEAETSRATARETAVSITAGGFCLRGMLCEPARDAGSGSRPSSSARRGLVFLNAGAIRRIGPNRLYVELARSWANRGLTSLRVDLSGVGDSDGQEPTGSRLYEMALVSQARSAIRFLREERGCERVTLLGLCSGAFVAFHTALADDAVDATLLVNPQLFLWTEGASLEVRRRTNYQASLHYRQSLLRRESWAKLLRGNVDVARLAKLLGARFVDVAKDRLSPLLDLVGERSEDQVLTAFRAALARGIDTYLLFCTGDPGLDNIQSHLGPGLRDLERHVGGGPSGRGTVDLATIHGPDHTFTPVWSQRALAELLTRRLFGD